MSLSKSQLGNSFKDKDGVQTSSGQAHPTDRRNSNSGNFHDVALGVPSDLIYRNMLFFIWLKLIGSYDSGAFSAALGAENGIAEEWFLSTTQQGTLTSSVFLGTIVGCPLAARLFSSRSQKQVLVWSLFFHTIFTFLFATFPLYYFAVISRFFIGLTLVFIIVYTPVWVDQFAPKARQSMWMASHNAGVPLGIFGGYIVGAFLPTYTNITWAWAFYLKCLFMIPTVAYISTVDRRSIDTIHKDSAETTNNVVLQSNMSNIEIGNNGNNREKSVEPNERLNMEDSGTRTNNIWAKKPSRADWCWFCANPQKKDRNTLYSRNEPAIAASQKRKNNEQSERITSFSVNSSAFTAMQSVFLPVKQYFHTSYSAIAPLLDNSIFMCSTLSMCSLYFVATGLQNFVTQYLRDDPFNASMKTIMLGFGISVITSPVCGVIVGGILLDLAGGYHKNLKRVSIFMLFWGFFAALFSFVCIFVTNTTSFLLVMSIVLFCGGAIIPPGSGLVMSSLPPSVRPAGAAFSQVLYNLLGNFSGPLVCGFVADWAGHLKYGMYAVLLSSSLGIIPIMILFLSTLKPDSTSTEKVIMTSVRQSISLTDIDPPSHKSDAYVMSKMASLIHEEEYPRTSKIEKYTDVIPKPSLSNQSINTPNRSRLANDSGPRTSRDNPAHLSKSHEQRSSPVESKQSSIIVPSFQQNAPDTREQFHTNTAENTGVTPIPATGILAPVKSFFDPTSMTSPYSDHKYVADEHGAMSNSLPLNIQNTPLVPDSVISLKVSFSSTRNPDLLSASFHDEKISTASLHENQPHSPVSVAVEILKPDSNNCESLESLAEDQLIELSNNQFGFGMDVVRSWILTQHRTHLYDDIETNSPARRLNLIPGSALSLHEGDAANPEP